jgi:spore maturation protein A
MNDQTIKGGASVINTVWMILLGLGIITALGTGKISLISETIFSSAGKAIEFTIGLAGIIAFWSGILKVAEAAGLTETVAKLFKPLLSKLFPSITRNNQALGLISLTMAANMLGLGNVATPLGLKTMEKLQSMNPHPERASDEICTFMALVFGGLSLIPSTLIAIRARAGSANPSIILGPVFLITLTGTIIGLIINFVAFRIYHQYQRKE